MPFKCGTLRCAIELGRHPGCLSLAHRVISLLRSNWVAFGAKRTLTSASHATGFMGTRLKPLARTSARSYAIRSFICSV
jgi:hypothetical protein